MKNNIIISYLLGEMFPEVARALRDILHGKIHELQTSRDIWCRDYLPVKGNHGLVQFIYRPSYLVPKKYNDTISRTNLIHEELGIKPALSRLILDGGAIEVYGEQAIVSNRVYFDNAHLSEEYIQDQLRDELGLSKLVVVPEYPYDFTGHVDGMIRFINDHQVLINDYEKEKDWAEKKGDRKLLGWINEFHSILDHEVYGLHKMTYEPKMSGSDDDAFGIYMNFLRLDESIVMPSFGLQADESAKKELCGIYKRQVFSVPSVELAKKGGIINCVTWNI
jgi:agmatine deiminase